MEDKTLLDIALYVGMIGITSLLILSYYDAIPEKGFGELSGNDINYRVKVNGTITNIYPHNSSTTLKVKQECVMDVFVMDTQNYTVGDTVSITGTVQEFNGRLEISAEKIVVR